MSSKYCLISDLHVGCHCDSENWHKIVLDWGNWLKDELIEKDIHNIIICGDFFHNRSEVGVKTMAVASELMDMWSDFEIKMITGNHDLFYKNRTDVSSVSIFGGRDNVELMSEMTTQNIAGKTVTFIPWGQNIEECPKSDVIFGHLEINGFKMMPGKVAEGRLTPKQLTSKSKLTFSGHFHLRDERAYKSAKIIYVGSPYQQNWGERSNIPGYYALDMKDLSYEFFENTISPKHVKITSNKIKPKDIKGNIISIDLDTSIGEEEIEKIKTKIYKSTPMEAKFNVSREVYDSNATITYDGNVNIIEVMNKYVDGLKLDTYTEDVKTKLEELFSKYSK